MPIIIILHSRYFDLKSSRLLVEHLKYFTSHCLVNRSLQLSHTETSITFAWRMNFILFRQPTSGYVHVVKISSSWTAKCNWQCTLQRSNICNINPYKNKQEFLHRTLYSSYLPPEIAKCNLHRTVQRSLIRNIKLYYWNKQKLLPRTLLYSLMSFIQ